MVVVAEVPWTGRWRTPLRVTVAGWWVVVAVAFALSIPAAFRARITTCDAGASCPPGSLSSVEAAGLEDLGLGLAGYVTVGLAFLTLLAVTCLAVAALLWRIAGGRPDALLTAAVLVAFAASAPQTLPALGVELPALAPWLALLDAATMVALVAWAVTLPDGRPDPGWILAPVVAAGVLGLAGVSGTAPGPWLGAGWVMVLLGVAAAVVVRYRSATGPDRRRTRWVAASLLGVVVALVVASVAQQGLGVRPGSLADLAVQVLVVAAFLSLPVAVTAAVLRRGLFDVEAALARTLTYAVLTAGAMSVHLLLVAAAGAASLDRAGASAVATAVVAVGVLPAFRRLRRAINRLLHGSRDDPATMLAALTSGSSEPRPADALVEAAEGVAQALRLPHVAVLLPRGDAFEHGTVPDGWRVHEEPLVHRGEAVGRLRLAARDATGTLAPADLRALGPVRAHLAVLARAHALDAELAASHRELVAAREEERRRLRNELHDGLGPTLGAVRLTLTAARNHLDADPEEARRLVEAARGQVAAAVVDVRHLVYGLRPPSLDDLGLVGALRAFVRGMDGADLRVDVRAPDRLPELSAATEVAAYRIALEAVTNAVRHSGAAACHVRITADDTWCTLVVVDDGRGGATPDGVGGRSMRERAAELGGRLAVESGQDGTTVRAVLPVRVGVDG